MVTLMKSPTSTQKPLNKKKESLSVETATNAK